MSRASGTRLAGLLLLGSIACTGALGCSSERPDVVLIVVDTLRRDHVSAYGGAVETPTLQALADSGQVFTNYQASYHLTTMSMGALFTGLMPAIESGSVRDPLAWEGRRSWCGMARFATSADDTCVPRGLTTLAESLQQEGYATLGVVSNGLLFAPAGYEQGFDTWIEVHEEREDVPRPIRAAGRSATQVNSALRRALAERPSGPAFVYAHFLDVHDYAAKGQTYAQAVAAFDRDFAETLDILEAAGVAGSFFVLSDHGENLGEQHGPKSYRGHYGNPSFQTLLDVPLIVSPPTSTDSDRPVTSRDIPRMVMEAAGLPGRAAAEPDLLEPGEIFVSERDYVTYRKGRFKTSLHRRKPRYSHVYDLDADPLEVDNAIGRLPDVARRHRERVREIVARLGASAPGEFALTTQDAERLRQLGYAE